MPPQHVPVLPYSRRVPGLTPYMYVTSGLVVDCVFFFEPTMWLSRPRS
ncbi:Uncharacterised protein [Mycobacteroides abscessus]|nr:Uncharacterised protein [Mycobacteroides abscessus]